jgi:hypothetical protein
VTAVADECRLVSNGLEVDLFPRSTHLCKLLLIGEDSIQRLSDLVDVEESHWYKSTTESDCCNKTRLTDKMAETCTQFDFGLYEGISISFKGHEQDFLHLVRQLTQTRQGCRRNR